MIPGITVCPGRSRTRAPAGTFTVALGPTAVIWSCLITTTAVSMDTNGERAWGAAAGDWALPTGGPPTMPAMTRAMATITAARWLRRCTNLTRPPPGFDRQNHHHLRASVLSDMTVQHP